MLSHHDLGMLNFLSSIYSRSSMIYEDEAFVYFSHETIMHKCRDEGFVLIRIEDYPFDTIFYARLTWKGLWKRFLLIKSL
jgi:hypothetical protein